MRLIISVFMRKVALISYMIHDLKGSEYSVAYNHVKLLSKRYELTVFFGTNGPFMGDRDKAFIDRLELLQNIRLVYVRPSQLALFWDGFNRNYGISIAWNIAYRLWHKKVGKWDFSNFDIVHLLNPIGFNEPGFLLGNNYKLVWGPIGGVYLPSGKLIEHLPFSTKCYYRIRQMYQSLLLNYP